jgi:hypothetical protein
MGATAGVTAVTGITALAGVPAVTGFAVADATEVTGLPSFTQPYLTVVS